ncbi:MAG TPA: TMEM175 family protein [Thermoplasmata archaeon]|nr:TMEM175 family protein [Thermoplasmata archaeon]
MAAHIERGRLESLSDLVFGLALSIGALILIGQAPSSAPNLMSDVSQFGYSFLGLITVWYRHTRTMAVFQVEAAWAMRLNFALLFLVSIEPFLFNLLFTETRSTSLTPFGNVSTAAHGLDLAGLLGILAALTYVAEQQAHRRGDVAVAGRFASESRLLAIGALMFGVSIVPQFYV